MGAIHRLRKHILITFFTTYLPYYTELLLAGVLGLLQHPQNLGVLLILFQPEGADYAHHITASTPGFENLTTALSMMQSHLFLIGNLTGIHLGLRTYVILLTNKVDMYLSVNLIRCEILYTQTNCFIIIRNVYNDNHSTQTCITNVITLNYLSHQAVVRQM